MFQNHIQPLSVVEQRQWVRKNLSARAMKIVRHTQNIFCLGLRTPLALNLVCRLSNRMPHDVSINSIYSPKHKQQMLNVCSVTKLLIPILIISFADVAIAEDKEIKTDQITVNSSVIDSRIRNYPATVETYDREQIQNSVNAATPAQAMKYLPSIQVRERFIGDRNGIIASRTIGAISSAQSMLFTDGILLSNLLGNRWDYPPRWGMVSPEEIESISMMYGPFSSLYAGNSFGGVISIHTRMPDKFETHASAQSFTQNFKLYGTDVTNRGNHETASIGNKFNDLSVWLGVDRLQNTGQPMDFAISNLSSNTTLATNVTGAYQDKSEKNLDRLIFGATNIDNSEQLNTKFKASYDITPELKANYTIGVWDFNGKTDVQSYLRDASGNAIYSGAVSFNGKRYVLPAMSPAKSEALHIMQALEIKSNSKGFFDWQLTLSDYEYQKDFNASSRLSGTANLNPYQSRAGIVNDLSGTGWTVFDARATLRPQNHLIDVGYHIDEYQLRSTTHSTSDWSSARKGNFSASSQGNTRTQALYIQDKWQLSEKWALTLGGRYEYWQASDGSNQTSTTVANYQDKSQIKFSPKISLSFEPEPAWGFRAAFGQAFRFPTVTELYQQLSNGNNIVINNPDLKPEEVLSAELTAERRYENGLIRLSGFNEHKYDALISQLNVASVGTTSTYVQNVDHIRTYGIEMATEWKDFIISGLDMHANATLTDAQILQNSAAPSNNGNVAPRIPKQLYKAVATYHVNQDFTLSLGARFSGRQYINLDNSDINPNTYRSASRFTMVDIKANYKFADRFTASLGVDNLTNDKVYVSHPLPQRTLYAQIKFDY
jgi:iron complex outermembrane recepter protein